MKTVRTPKALWAAAALAALPGCFGTGVTPATLTTLAVDDALTLRPGETAELAARNVGLQRVAARHVRLHLSNVELMRNGALDVDYDPNCEALAADDTCRMHLRLASWADVVDFPSSAAVYGDNTNPAPVTLFVTDDDGDMPPPRPEDEVQLVVDDVRVAPPAPATSTLVLRNVSPHALLVQSLNIDASAGLVLDTSSCTGYPKLAPDSTCSVTVRAPASAVPGTYRVSAAYAGHYGHGQAAGRATVDSGALVVNNGAPIALDGNATIYTVAVQNNGFNLPSVDISLPWSDTCRGQPSLTVNTSTCQNVLPANATCQVVLSTFGATPGATSQLNADATQGNVQLSASQPVQISSMHVNLMQFSAPGSQDLVLDNLGTQPISVRDVRVGGNRSAGLPAPSSADLAACQRFTGSCRVPVQARQDAWVEGGVGTVEVTYVSGGIVQRAIGSVSVAPAAIMINAFTDVVLSAVPQTRQVVLGNQGPFAWANPGLELVPPIPGVRITTDCNDTLAANASCNANVVTDFTTPYGLTSRLLPAGPNGAAPAANLVLQRPVLLVAQGTNSDPVLISSYDDGTHWNFLTAPPTGLGMQRAALGRRAWVVVGGANGNQAVYVSPDRGTSWQSVLFDDAAGVLEDVAVVPNGFVAVGHGPGGAVVRRSADGVSWTPATSIAGVSGLQAVACAGGNCVATGSPDSLGGGTALHSLDGGVTWLPKAADYLPPDFAGMLLGAAASGNVFVLAGEAAGGGAVLVKSDSGANGLFTAQALTPGGYGAARDVASNGVSWLAVGDSGSNAVANVCSVHAADVFTTVNVLGGNASLYGVAWLASSWMAVGHDGNGSGILHTSQDGTHWLSSLMSGTQAIFAIAVGD